MKTSWEEAIKIARTADDHYSITELQQKRIYEIVSTLPAGSEIVELGVCRGKTAMILAYVAKHRGLVYTGVDDFSLEGSEAEIKNNMEKFKLPHNLLVGKTGTVMWDKQIDFLIVDAGHDPINVERDCERWVPLVRKGGYVCFHDYDEPYNPKSAHWGIRFYGDRATKGWKDIDFIKGLKIKQRTE